MESQKPTDDEEPVALESIAYKNFKLENAMSTYSKQDSPEIVSHYGKFDKTGITVKQNELQSMNSTLHEQRSGFDKETLKINNTHGTDVTPALQHYPSQNSNKPLRIPVLSSRNILHNDIVQININKPELQIQVREIDLLENPREYVELKQRQQTLNIMEFSRNPTKMQIKSTSKSPRKPKSQLRKNSPKRLMTQDSKISEKHDGRSPSITHALYPRMVEGSNIVSPIRRSSLWLETAANNDLSMVYENPMKISPSKRHEIFMKKQEIIKTKRYPKANITLSPSTKKMDSEAGSPLPQTKSKKQPISKIDIAFDKNLVINKRIKLESPLLQLAQSKDEFMIGMATQVSHADIAAGATLLHSNSSNYLTKQAKGTGVESTLEEPILINLSYHQNPDVETNNSNINYVNLEIKEHYTTKKSQVLPQKLKIKTKNQMIQNSSLKTLHEEAQSPDIPQKAAKQIKKVQINNKFSPNTSKMTIIPIETPKQPEVSQQKINISNVMEMQFREQGPTQATPIEVKKGGFNTTVKLKKKVQQKSNYEKIIHKRYYSMAQEKNFNGLKGTSFKPEVNYKVMATPISVSTSPPLSGERGHTMSSQPGYVSKTHKNFKKKISKADTSSPTNIDLDHIIAETPGRFNLGVSYLESQLMHRPNVSPYLKGSENRYSEAETPNLKMKRLTDQLMQDKDIMNSFEYQIVTPPPGIFPSPPIEKVEQQPAYTRQNTLEAPNNDLTNNSHFISFDPYPQPILKVENKKNGSQLSQSQNLPFHLSPTSNYHYPKMQAVVRTTRNHFNLPSIQSPLLNSYKDLAKFKEFAVSNFHTIEQAKRETKFDFSVKFTRNHFKGQFNTGFDEKLRDEIRLPNITSFAAGSSLKGSKLKKSTRYYLETENSDEIVENDTSYNETARGRKSPFAVNKAQMRKSKHDFVSGASGSPIKVNDQKYPPKNIYKPVLRNQTKSTTKENYHKREVFLSPKRVKLRKRNKEFHSEDFGENLMNMNSYSSLDMSNSNSVSRVNLIVGLNLDNTQDTRNEASMTMQDSIKPSKTKLHDSLVTSASKVKLGSFEERFFLNKHFADIIKDTQESIEHNLMREEIQIPPVSNSMISNRSVNGNFFQGGFKNKIIEELTNRQVLQDELNQLNKRNEKSNKKSNILNTNLVQGATIQSLLEYHKQIDMRPINISYVSSGIQSVEALQNAIFQRSGQMDFVEKRSGLGQKLKILDISHFKDNINKDPSPGTVLRNKKYFTSFPPKQLDQVSGDDEDDINYGYYKHDILIARGKSRSNTNVLNLIGSPRSPQKVGNQQSLAALSGIHASESKLANQKSINSLNQKYQRKTQSKMKEDRVGINSTISKGENLNKDLTEMFNEEVCKNLRNTNTELTKELAVTYSQADSFHENE